VEFTVENMRVEERTDYNRLKLEIETDGSLSPSEALHKAGNILKDHFEKVAAVEVTKIEPPKMEEGEKKKKSKKEE
jgi:DNA-directed RNA polymerase subunit alpha